MNPAQLALQETRAKVPENSVSTPFTYLVQLHLVGREVILLGLSDSPGECTLSTQLKFLTLLKVGRPTEWDRPVQKALYLCL